MKEHVIKFLMLVIAGFFLYLLIELSEKHYYSQDTTLMTETIVVTPDNKEE